MTSPVEDRPEVQVQNMIDGNVYQLEGGEQEVEVTNNLLDTPADSAKVSRINEE